MATNLKRTLSMITDNRTKKPNIVLSTNLEALTDDNINRSLQSPYGLDKSPLKIFVKSKKKINDIYCELEKYVIAATCLIDGLPKEIEIVHKAEQELFQSYVSTVSSIRKVISMDHMKVAFFGRTSSGKSSVINAMLREHILPSGIGHTTHCFCQVEGVDSTEGYLVKEGSDEKFNIADIKQLANARCEEKLSERSLVKIYWPQKRCSLLCDDVVFLDSPGIDVSPNLDYWIDNHCLDSDVFVLVLNAESTMTLAEKSFFHKVSQRLWNPNIFVLNNRWDASVNEPEFQYSVRLQHQERCSDFLVKELKVCTQKEAAERVFFVSAREILLSRLEEAQENSAYVSDFVEGFQSRQFEFQDFERKFAECISKSAVRTKFKQHSLRGKDISAHLHSMLDNIYYRARTLRNTKLKSKKLLRNRIKERANLLMTVTREMELKINNMIEEVEENVAKALNEEIWSLGVLIDKFNMPFHTETLVLNIYKKKLNAHIESRLISNLRAELSTALEMNVKNTQREMTELLHSLIPSEQLVTQTNQIISRSQPFEILYSLNCRNLCSDFQEDLEFKFSWGITAMIQRFTGKVKGSNIRQAVLQMYRQNSVHNIIAPIANGPEIPSSIVPVQGNGIMQHISMTSRFALASIGSQSTISGLLVAGVLLKTMGWHILGGVGALYSCVYLYERFLWTNSAKERAFKGQYLKHATKKLRMIVDLTAANCSHQVQQELFNTSAQLHRAVDTVTTEKKEELKELENDLSALESKRKQIKLLRNKANYIQNEFEIFENIYLN